MSLTKYCPDDFKDLGGLQRWSFFVRERGGEDIAFAHGILIHPDRGGRDQEILFLPGSVVRRTAGISDPERASIDRQSLITRNILVDDGTGQLVLMRPVIFPSFSRAGGVMCGRSENGWKLLKGKVNDQIMTIDDAYKLDQEGKCQLVYYRDPPDGVASVSY